MDVERHELDYIQHLCYSNLSGRIIIIQIVSQKISGFWYGFVDGDWLGDAWYFLLDCHFVDELVI